MKITPRDDTYPRRLLDLEVPPTITTSGPLDPHASCIAIVGARGADARAREWTRQLAYHLARAGFVIVSGGAVGIDAAAHDGAMRAGATWCVAPNGQGADFPSSNGGLFDDIARSGSSRMIWPFPDGTRKTRETPRFRNGVLVALASTVIVIQARLQSGSRNAARWASLLGRRLFVVPGRPWDWEFQASHSLLVCGLAEPLFTMDQLFRALELRAPRRISDKLPQPAAIRHIKRRECKPAEVQPEAVDPSLFSPDENRIISAMLEAPMHQEEIIDRTGLPASTTVSALLTLSLRDVVVEGPDGFFRRRS